jgi:pectin methylesterase-like acyl-CoA thioesterase
VAGTVDVVLSNAAAVLQNCTLRARLPLPRQKNTVTAQGRTDPNQSTGISLHRCRLVQAPELAEVQRGRAAYPMTYLGRPWKPYARAVYMMSSMAEHVDAGGWLAWDSSGRAPDSTVYYGEYRNFGPGAAVAGPPRDQAGGGGHGVHRGEVHRRRLVAAAHRGGVRRRLDRVLLMFVDVD